MNNRRDILILGAGKVASPLVAYFLDSKYLITVASEYLYQAELVIQNNPLGEAIEWHASEDDKLNGLIKKHKIVVSLLPFSLHIIVCKACIKQRRSLVTTSYQQPKMEELHSDACKSNITILNEVGLDPGIDHMWACKSIDNIKKQGGEIEKFISVCGALPAPESLDNPFRYKFSWSPMGVVRASSSQATYLRNNIITKVEADKLMQNTFSVSVDKIGEFDAYANRDSLKYLLLYKIPNASTLFRGTLRYKGWAEAISILIKAGYFSEKEIPKEAVTFSELTSKLSLLETPHNVRDEFAKKHQIKTHSNGIMAMEWLGLFSNSHYSNSAKSPLEVLTNRMTAKMKMLPSDKDLIVLNIQMLYSIDNKRQVFDGTFVRFGRDNEETAIANSVSMPAAYAVELILNKKIAHKGIVRPIYKEFYDPILNKLKEKNGFKFSEVIKNGNEWPNEW